MSIFNEACENWNTSKDKLTKEDLKIIEEELVHRLQNLYLSKKEQALFSNKVMPSLEDRIQQRETELEEVRKLLNGA